MAGPMSKEWLDKEIAEADATFEKYPPEWHNEKCTNRHGVIRNIPKSSIQEVIRAIECYYGRKGQWWVKDGATYSVEFTHMCKVYPPPKDPWGWCGEAVLPKHRSIHRQEQIAGELRSLYRIGQEVSFNFRGRRLTGIIANTGRRATVVIPGSETRYFINYHNLE